MATHWKTKLSNMDNPLLRPSAQSLQKPQVFVKVEFGVSWNQHSPRRRGFEYKSRALRERNPEFPRHVPGPTTNYLAAAPTHVPRFTVQTASPSREHPPYTTNQSLEYPRETQLRHSIHADHMLPEPRHPARGRSRYIEAIPEPPWLGLDPDQERRLSSGERHERGTSAPPPLSDNNWDVVQGRAETHGTAGPSGELTMEQDRASSDVWKDLPEVPTRFRLGEEGLPWEGTWTFPMGFEPFLEPDPYLRPASSHSSPKPSSTHRRSDSSPQPISGPISMNDPSPQSPPSRSDDPNKRRELEALGSAMMTVDNGFETQWWNQEERGERLLLAALHPPPATEQQVEEQMALGWVGALLPGTAPGDSPSNRRTSLVRARGESILSPESSYEHGRAYNSNAVVSPVSSNSGPVMTLSRSMSTRSDELWFSGGRCA